MTDADRPAGRLRIPAKRKMKKYIAIGHGFRGNDLTHWTGSSCECVFDTLEEANDAAEDRWSSTRAKHWAVEVFAITENDLSDDAVDEYSGEIDWHAWEYLRYEPYGVHKYYTKYRLVIIDKYGNEHDIYKKISSGWDGRRLESGYTLNEYFSHEGVKDKVKHDIERFAEKWKFDLEEGYSFDDLLETGQIKLIPEIR